MTEASACSNEFGDYMRENDDSLELYHVRENDDSLKLYHVQENADSLKVCLSLSIRSIRQMLSKRRYLKRASMRTICLVCLKIKEYKPCNTRVHGINKMYLTAFRRLYSSPLDLRTISASWRSYLKGEG